MNQRHTFHHKKLLSLLLAGALSAGCTLPAAAQPIGNNVFPTYDEAYYATLDYYGNLTNGSVVKSYTMNGATSLTDFGSYDEIINLTNGTQPESQDGSATFRFDADNAPSHFYFEGKTAAPFETLPWTISVCYTLNGVPTPAEELAGKTGVVEIIIDAVPNENASEYAKNNYTLEATAMFNQDDILSLEAPGAQVQLIGNLRVVLFATLPGETHHCVIRVGADHFTFDGLTFLLVPATLSQLEEISKLSQRKDDLEADYNKLSGSLDNLLNSFSALGGSLRDTASGLDQLNEARETLSQGKEQLYADGDRVLADLDRVQTSMSTLPGHLDNADTAVGEVTDSLNKVSSSAVQLQKNLRELSGCMTDIQNDMENIRKESGDMEENLTQLGKDMDHLKESLDETRETIENLDIKINGGILDALPDEVKENITIQGMTGAELQAALDSAAPIQNAWNVVTGQKKDSINYEEYQLAVMLATDPSLTPEKARSALKIFSAVDAMNPRPTTQIGVWTAIYGILTDQGYCPVSASIAAGLFTKEYFSYQQKLPAIRQVYEALCGSTDASMNHQEFFAAMLMLKDLKSLTPEQAEAGGAAAILARKDEYLQDAAKLCAAMEAVNSDYDLTAVIGLMSHLSDVLEHVGTDGLTGNLKRLLKSVNKALGTLDTTADAGQDLLHRLDSILDEVDELSGTINQHVPGLRSAIRDTRTLISDMVLSVGDTSAFLHSFRALSQSAGDQLDEGTRKSLESLSKTLRRTAATTDAVGDVKTAKDAVSGIVEDTWNAFTGEVNNMLMMDPHAQAQSLTSAENPAPSSVQVLIRTQEIKEETPAEEHEDIETTASLTFWGRIKKMFRDFWNTITGIFH